MIVQFNKVEQNSSLKRKEAVENILKIFKIRFPQISQPLGKYEGFKQSKSSLL